MLQKRRIISSLIQEMVILRNILQNLLIVCRNPQSILKSKNHKIFLGLRVLNEGVLSDLLAHIPLNMGQFMEYGVLQNFLDNSPPFGIIHLSL
jgi:hypothetical protein